MLKLANKTLRVIMEITLTLTMIICLVGCGCGRDEDSEETRMMPIVGNVERTLIENATESVTSEQHKEDETNNATNPSEDPHGDEGGNQYSNDSQEKVFEINILVSENEYYYDNAPILLVELEKKINDIEGNKIVVIANNNASQSAYKKLTDTLDRDGVSYKEKQD